MPPRNGIQEVSICSRLIDGPLQFTGWVSEVFPPSSGAPRVKNLISADWPLIQSPPKPDDGRRWLETYVIQWKMSYLDLFLTSPRHLTFFPLLTTDDSVSNKSRMLIVLTSALFSGSLYLLYSFYVFYFCFLCCFLSPLCFRSLLLSQLPILRWIIFGLLG